MFKCDCTIDTCEQLCEHPQVICLAKDESLPDTDAQQIAEVFRLLGDTTRVKILDSLSKRELCVCDLAVVVGMERTAVSHQLRLLRNAGLVKYRKEGKMAYYSIDDKHIELLISQCLQHVEEK